MLFEKTRSIANNRPATQSIDFDLKPLRRRILEFLSDFANGARYENLDALVSGGSAREPFVEWQDIL
jgi:hypothetical protein